MDRSGYIGDITVKGSKLRKGSTINLRTKRTGTSGRLVETKGTVLFNTRRVEGDDIAEDNVVTILELGDQYPIQA